MTSKFEDNKGKINYGKSRRLKDGFKRKRGKRTFITNINKNLSTYLWSYNTRGYTGKDVRYIKTKTRKKDHILTVVYMV